MMTTQDMIFLHFIPRGIDNQINNSYLTEAPSCVGVQDGGGADTLISWRYKMDDMGEELAIEFSKICISSTNIKELLTSIESPELRAVINDVLRDAVNIVQHKLNESCT